MAHNIRPLKPEELKNFTDYVRDAFVVPENKMAEWVENAIKNKLENTRAVVEDNGEIKAVMRFIFPELWLGNGKIPMPGITSVATPPEYRRKGSINFLIKGVLEELNRSGYGICTLYPFYFPFYKKFGYEQVSDTKVIMVKIGQLQKFKPRQKGNWRPATPDQWPEFDRIYRQACQGKFGQLTRDEDWWRNTYFKTREGTLKAYLWYDAANQAQAYLLYSFKLLQVPFTREMQIRDMGWTNTETYREVLAFLANHDSQCQQISFSTAPDDAIFALLDDPRETEVKTLPGYMLRIVNTIKALEERPWPTTVKGSFSLGLKDDLLSWNNQNLKVTLNGGKARVEVLTETAPVGLSCDIRQLSQLYAGYLSPRQLLSLGLIEAWNGQDLEIAQQAFAPSGQPASFMRDHF